MVDTNSSEINPDNIREEMSEAQVELRNALDDLLIAIGNKLSDKEKQQITDDVYEINEILERLKSGQVWITVFGKTNAGKSSLINSIIGKDVAEVDIVFDTTTQIKGYAKDYKEGRWNIVDVPGVMGDIEYEQLAIEEAKKAHGHIFVVDDEPYQDEVEIFDLVHDYTPDIPKIVFVNKWDVIESSMTREHRKKKKEIIIEKMSKYVQSPENILFGSARLYDRESDQMVRQNVPALLEELYDSAGTLGIVMNVLDPANKAEQTVENIYQKIFEVRSTIARRIIYVFSTVSVGATFVPFDTITVAPALHTSMVKILLRVMGWRNGASDEEVSESLVWEYYKGRWWQTGLIGSAEGLLSALVIFGPLGYAFDLVMDLLILGMFKFGQTALLGEVAIEYAKKNFNWGNEKMSDVISRCKDRAKVFYNYIKIKQSKETLK